MGHFCRGARLTAGATWAWLVPDGLFSVSSRRFDDVKKCVAVDGAVDDDGSSLGEQLKGHGRGLSAGRGPWL